MTALLAQLTKSTSPLCQISPIDCSKAKLQDSVADALATAQAASIEADEATSNASAYLVPLSIAIVVLVLLAVGIFCMRHRHRKVQLHVLVCCLHLPAIASTDILF